MKANHHVQRKSDTEAAHPAKKRSTQIPTGAETKSKALPVRKAKKAAAVKRPKQKTTSLEPEREAPSSERRRSGRIGGRKSYTETADSDDDIDPEALDNDCQVEGDRALKSAKKTKTVVALSETDEELSDPPASDEE